MHETYEVNGPADAPALVFLHAASYTRKAWLPQTDALSGEFRVLALDLPAHGARAAEPFTFEAAHAAVTEALDAEQMGRAVLIGVSLGGCLAMEYAAAHPARVAGLVLSGATFHARWPITRLILWGEALTFRAIPGRLTAAYHRFICRQIMPEMVREIIPAGSYWEGAAQAVLAIAGRDFCADLARYPGPTLILNGERDWVHRTGERGFVRAAQNARAQVVPRGNHVPNLDDPDFYTQAVRAFARTCQFTQRNATYA